jgi:hypothetical protein
VGRGHAGCHRLATFREDRDFVAFAFTFALVFTFAFAFDTDRDWVIFLENERAWDALRASDDRDEDLASFCGESEARNEGRNLGDLHDDIDSALSDASDGSQPSWRMR